MIRGFYATPLVCISCITAGCGGSAMSKTEYGKVYSEAYSKGHKEGFEKGMNAGGYMGGYIDPYNPLPYGMQSQLSMAVQAGKLSAEQQAALKVLEQAAMKHGVILKLVEIF